MSTTAIIRHRRDTAANLTSSNPVLEDGQFCFETDTGYAKLGDGATAWNALTYATVSKAYIDAAVAAAGVDTRPLIYGGI